MGRRIHMEHPAISLLLCVQLDKLRELGGNAGLYYGGFIPRLIILVPDSLVGGRFWTEEQLNDGIQDAYTAAITARLDKYSDQAGEHVFPIAPDAKAAWVEYYNAIEEDMAGKLSEHAPLAARWQTLPVRLAAIIAEYSDRDTITLDDMHAAIELAGYLIEHGRRAAGIMGRGLSSDLERAVKHIKDKDLKRFKPNDLAQAMRATASETANHLENLERAGLVRATGETEGHKNAPVYEAHPEIWE